MASATIRDVAKAAGVGIGTVSRVLNKHPSVSRSTRAKVLATIEELDFRPNLQAQRLSRGHTGTIGVVGPLFLTESYLERLRGIEYASSGNELDLVLFNVETKEQRQRVLRRISRRERVDGLIIISIKPDDQEVTRLHDENVPTVLIDTHHPALSYVTVNNVEGGYKATRHLIELGHTRIGYIAEFMDNSFNFETRRDRSDGYALALAEAGIQLRPEYHMEGAIGSEAAQEMARELLMQPEPPTAIFAMTDKQAFGVMKAAKDLGFQIPDDLSLVGYDDIEISRYLNLTTVRQLLFQSGQEGVRILLDKVEGRQKRLVQKELAIELIPRGSTQAMVAESVAL